MELGATLCTPRSPQCLLCPISEHCEGRKLGIAEELPEARKKRDAVDVALVSLIVTNSKNETLLLPPPRQKDRQDLADHVPTLVSNLWHFPTVSVNSGGKTVAIQAWKEFFTGKASPPSKFRQLPPVKHSVTYRKVMVYPFLVHLKRLPKWNGAKTVALKDVTGLAISNLTRKIAKRGLIALMEKPG
jgi:adenine-specific DNA glycosylase